jgi:hypothetical protein
VLALRGDSGRFVAVVKTATEDGGSVTFLDGTVQKYGPITFKDSLHRLDWAAGTKLDCSADPAVTAKAGDKSDKLTSGTVVKLDDKTVELAHEDGKTEEFPLAACRYRVTWWDRLAPHYTNYAKYEWAKALPARGAAQPTAEQVRSAFAAFAPASGYGQVKKCVVTGKDWVTLRTGSRVVARTVDVACGMALPIPPKPRENFECLVEYGACYQEVTPSGQFGGCQWKLSSDDHPSQRIKCSAL